jgi:hypothetical protein
MGDIGHQVCFVNLFALDKTGAGHTPGAKRVRSSLRRPPLRPRRLEPESNGEKPLEGEVQGRRRSVARRPARNMVNGLLIRKQTITAETLWKSVPE